MPPLPWGIGILEPQLPEASNGLLGPATVNPLLARQIAAQRGALPRTDVTDLFGYGPSWETYWQNAARNSQELLPRPDDPAAIPALINLMGLGGMTVFHGSPHKFSKFDMSKVGTGEGAQAYGHGLYFAEKPNTAKYYAEVLADNTPRVKDGFDYQPYDLGILGQMVKQSDGTLAGVKKIIANERGANADIGIRQLLDRIESNLDAGNYIVPGKTGSVYRVDLPDEQIAKMLDWDKPLSQQPENVRKAFDSALANDTVYQAWKTNGAYPHISGKLAYERVVDLMGKGRGGTYGAQGAQSAAASASLQELGIPGIKYLDQGSRSGGKGTYNFVVFDDQIPKIIGRE